MTIIRRQTRAGKIRYGVKVDRPGRKQEWIGTFDTLTAARKAQAGALLQRRATPMACDRWADHWLEDYRERNKTSSYNAAASALRKFMTDFRGIPLSRVSRVEAEKWARVNRWRVPVVVALFNAAVDAELVDRNPFKGMVRKGAGRRYVAPLTESDVAKLAASARRLRGQMMASFIVFTAYSGMRVGEVFALQWGDIDFERNRIAVRRRLYRGELALPKSNRPRTIVLAPPARDALLPLDRSTEWVFLGARGGRLSQSGLAYYWRGIEAAFGRKIVPHELKHFAGHYLYVTLGLPDRVVAEQLGHRDGGKLVRELYGHGDVGALEEIDEAFSNVIPIEKARNA